MRPGLDLDEFMTWTMDELREYEKLLTDEILRQRLKRFGTFLAPAPENPLPN